MLIHLGPAGVPGSAAKSDTISGIVRVANDLADEVGKKAKDLGIKLSVHAPYYINLCNPEKVKASQKRILDSCERAHHMGAKVVVFHPGFYGELEKEEALSRVTAACREMSDALSSNGWDVKLGLETTGKMSQFGTVDEILSVCKEAKSCVPVLDWAHLHAKYQGNADFKRLLTKVTSAGYLNIHTHFSNIEFGEKGEKRHLTIEHKQPDFKDVARIILDSDLEEITIISESPALEKDAMVMKKELEKMGYVSS